MLLHELRNARFFDVFEYNGVEQQWGCFLCNHPDRARGFVDVRNVFIYVRLEHVLLDNSSFFFICFSLLNILK